MTHRQAPADPASRRAGWSRPSSRASSRRYVEYDFTASISRRSSTRFPTASSPGRTCCATSGSDFSASVEEIKDLRVTDVLDALNEELAPLVFPAREDGSDPRICPTCGTGKLSLKLGKYGAFVGCSNYPECSYTRQLGAEGAEGEAARGRHQGARHGPRIPARRSRCAPAASAPMSSAATARKPSASSLPKGWTPEAIDHEKALRAAGAAARRRQASRDRQDDLRRHRPLRPVRAA